jgi:hypothetical protein
LRLLPLLKSTEVGLPEGLKFTDDNGEPLGDVKRCDIYVEGLLVKDGGFCASVQTYVTTLEGLKESKVKQFEQSAESEAKGIKALTPNREVVIQTIIDKLTLKLAEVGSKTTIQDAELIAWNE